MKRNGSDWWKKHHGAFYGSLRVWKLGPEAACLFDFMLGWQWEEGSVPDDPEFVRSRWPWHKRDRDRKAFEKLWVLVRPMFEARENGLVNVVQAGHSDATRAQREGWKLRQERVRADSARDVTQPSEETSPLEERREEKRRGEEKRGEERRGEENAELRSATRDKRAAHAATSSATRLVSDFWCDRFLKLRGSKYVWQGAKDGALLARLLKATDGDVAEVQRRIERFLTDPFWAGKSDWSKFCSQYNAMAGNGKPIDPFQQAAADLGVEWHR